MKKLTAFCFMLLLATGTGFADDAIFTAIRAGDVHGINQILNANPQEISSKDYGYLRTPVLVAARAGNVACMNALVERHAALDARDVQESTAIHLAAASGNPEAVAYLLDKGLAIESRDLLQSTPLLVASQEGTLPVVKLLIERGADLHCKDALVQGLLHRAAIGGKVEIMAFLTEQHFDVNEPAKSGTTALHKAVFYRQLEAVKFLLDHGADINALSQGGSVLAMATEVEGNKPSFPVIPLLLSRNADPNIGQGIQALLPLSLGARYGNVTLMSVLLDHGANINATDKNQNTPLHIAIYSHQFSAAKFLVEHGADINARERQGLTPFALWNKLNQKPTASDRQLGDYLANLGSSKEVIQPPESPRITLLKKLKQDASAPLQNEELPPNALPAVDPKLLAARAIYALQIGQDAARADYYFDLPELLPMFTEILKLNAVTVELRNSAFSKFGVRIDSIIPDPQKIQEKNLTEIEKSKLIVDGDTAVLVPENNAVTLQATYFIRIAGRWMINGAKQLGAPAKEKYAQIINDMTRERMARIEVALLIEAGDLTDYSDIPAAIMTQKMILSDKKRN